MFSKTSSKKATGSEWSAKYLAIATLITIICIVQTQGSHVANSPDSKNNIHHHRLEEFQEEQPQHQAPEKKTLRSPGDISDSDHDFRPVHHHQSFPSWTINNIRKSIGGKLDSSEEQRDEDLNRNKYPEPSLRVHIPQESGELPTRFVDPESAQIYLNDHDVNDQKDHHHKTHESVGTGPSNSEFVDPSPSGHIQKISSHFRSTVRYVRYKSRCLLSFLPEYLHHSILDANDALILTGIIAVSLVCVCVPYIFIEKYMALRPLQKKLWNVNRNLWKVTTAYLNQEEDLDIYKAKAFAYDEEKAKNEKLEAELEKAQKIQVFTKRYCEEEVRFCSRLANDVDTLMGAIMKERDEAVKELQKIRKDSIAPHKYKRVIQALQVSHSETIQSSRKITELTHSNEMKDRVVDMLNKQIVDYKVLLQIEAEKQKALEIETEKHRAKNDSLRKKLKNKKTLLHECDETMYSMSEEIRLKENELMFHRGDLGDESSLVAELSSKLKVAQENERVLELRVENLTFKNENMSQNIEELTKSVAFLEITNDEAKSEFLSSEMKSAKQVKDMERHYQLLLDEHDKKMNSYRDHCDEKVKHANERTETHKEQCTLVEKHLNKLRVQLAKAEKRARACEIESEKLRRKLTTITSARNYDYQGQGEENGFPWLGHVGQHHIIFPQPKPVYSERSEPMTFPGTRTHPEYRCVSSQTDEESIRYIEPPSGKSWIDESSGREDQERTSSSKTDPEETELLPFCDKWTDPECGCDSSYEESKPDIEPPQWKSWTGIECSEQEGEQQTTSSKKDPEQTESLPSTDTWIDPEFGGDSSDEESKPNIEPPQWKSWTGIEDFGQEEQQERDKPTSNWNQMEDDAPPCDIFGRYSNSAEPEFLSLL